ncbi:ABC transporter substrate-binding protein [Aurantivibrio plasticivorans]
MRLWVLFLSLFLVACGPSPVDRINVGLNVWPGYAPLYLAEDLGYLNKSKVRLTILPSASEVMHAVRTGVLDAAALTLDETLSLIDDGYDLTVVLIFDYSHGGDVLLAKPYIESLATLKGRSIAVENTAVGALLLQSALEKAQLRFSDIDMQVCGFGQHIACYENADAIVTFEPVKSHLIRQGAVSLFDSSSIPDTIVDVLVVNNTTMALAEKPVQHLIDAYFRARQFMRDQPDEAMAIIGERLSLNSSDMDVIYSGIEIPERDDMIIKLSGKPSPLETTASSLAQFMYENKLIKSPLKINQLTSDNFVIMREE